MMRPRPARSVADERPRGVGGMTLAAVAAVALLATTTPPATAAEPPSSTGDGAPRVEGFGLGDGLEGMIDPRDGAVRFAFPVAGLSLGWDSRLVGVDRDGLSSGWGWGPSRVERDGGTAVRAASGDLHQVDASSPSGLLGYDLPDLVFRAEPGVLPARTDGVSVDGDPAAAVPYEFVLRELGGRTTYYDAAGAQVVQVAATGDRSDWTWSETEPGRLTGMIGTHGEVTRLNWSTAKVVISTGADRVWTVRFDERGVTSVTDPVRGVVDVRSDARGLVAEIDGVSGASTRFSWRDAPADGVPSVDEVVTVDDDEVQLSSRTWGPVGDGPASGWPRTDPAAGVHGTGGFETQLSDGAIRLVSTYDAALRLTRRVVEVATRSGAHEVQRQRFAYPEPSGGQGGAQLPADFARPTHAEVVFRDARGATRTVSEAFGFDALGRLTSRVLADGTRLTTRYDEERPEADAPPIGLPIEQRTEAPDGSVSVTVHSLTPQRTAVAAVEQFAGDSAETLASVGRTEFEVRGDGFVTEQRELPSDGGVPRVTRWAETVDRARGEVTVSETIGVGTAAEATSARTTSVLHGGVVRAVDPFGNTAAFEHDAAGRLTAATDAVGRRSTTRYESAQADGRNAVTTTGPDRVAATEVRDALGRVTRLLDNVVAGAVVEGHERVVESRAYPDAATVVVTDAWGATSTARADVLGRPVEAITSTGAVLRTEYDDVAGTATSGLTPTGDLADAELVTREARDAMGRVVETTGERADGANVPELTARFDARGRPTTTRIGSLSTTVGYGPLGEPETTTVAATAPDGAGDSVAAGSAAQESTAIVASRRFDGFGASVEQTLADASGSRSGGERGFDAVGRVVTAHDGTTYVYDAANRRIGTTSPGGRERTTIDYWSDGTREQVTATPDGVGSVPRSTRFYWSGSEVVNEIHDAPEASPGTEAATGTGTASYLLGLDRHARTAQAGGTSTTSFSGTDRHGSVVELTDERGRVVERYAYSDWGEPLGAVDAARPRATVGDVTANAFGYSGEYHDADGLQHLHARDYDAGTRRLTSVDPVRHHNAYAYADADPITKVDPTGRTASADALHIGFAVLGAALAVAGLLVGGLTLTPFGVAAATANLLDTTLAIVEVVNVAGPRILSAEAATALTVVGVLTGAATLAAGIREAMRRAPKAAAAAADEYHLMDELPPAPTRPPDPVDPPAPVRPPVPVEPADGLSPAELQARRAAQIELYDGDQRRAFTSTMMGMDAIRASVLTGPNSVSLLASRVRQQLPNLMGFALQDTGPFVSMRQLGAARVRWTLWDEFTTAGVNRPALHRDVTGLIRSHWLTANRRFAATSLDMLDRRLGEGSRLITNQATDKRISGAVMFSTLQEVNTARAMVTRARQLLTQALRRPY